MRRLYFLSDLHLEVKGNIGVKYLFKPTEGYRNFLALCGDIGNPFSKEYREFLDNHSKLYEKIFLILGNHEYYYNNIEDVDAEMLKIKESYSNIIPLQKETINIDDDITVAGCTLWTEVDESAEKIVNDYTKIYTGDLKIKYLDILSKHYDMREWIEEQTKNIQSKNIQSKKNRKIIMLTHHAPSKKMLNSKYFNDSTNICYASDCEDLIKDPIILWISGHTHHSTKQIIM